MHHHHATVYPSVPVLPHNLLRMHVFFSEPPFVDRLMQAVRLLDDRGGVVAQPFLDLQEGLWDASGTRLTLLLHPGRIKSGLASSLSRGPALLQGQRLQLALDMGLLFGPSMAGAVWYTHTFNVGHALDLAIEHSAWHVRPPAFGTRQPLRLTFDRPLDRLALESAFTVTAADGGLVQCVQTVGASELSVYLTPQTPWQTGPYFVDVAQELEDIAGNRSAQAFEQRRDAAQNRDDNVVSAPTPLRFFIEPVGIRSDRLAKQTGGFGLARLREH